MVYSVGREEAADRLGMSTRTVDRYIRRGKIRSRKVGKLIMLHRDDVDVLMNGWVQQDYEIVQPAESKKETTTTPSTQVSTTVGNDILEILNKKMQEKDEIIQELSYKVGKLESELANSIPKLEHRKATLMLEEAQHKRAEDAHNLKEKNQQLEKKLGQERNISTFFIISSVLLILGLVVLIVKYFELTKIIGS